MRIGIFLIYFLVVPGFLTTVRDIPKTDYISEFGQNWVNAENILLKNHISFLALADSFQVPYKEVISIVFPELVRYSAIRNKIEVTLLKTLYVYKGEDYADFSVGIFQMKPSFAEKIREEVWVSEDKKLKAIFGSHNFIPTNTNHREQLVAELDDPIFQFKYLIAFYKLCEMKFGDNVWKDKTEKIRFYATAYNCGFSNSREYIKSMEDKKFFSINTFKTGPFYSYSDIAAFYYQTCNS